MTISVDDARAQQRTADAVRKIRDEIVRSRASGNRPDGAEFERTLTELRRLSTVNAHWGIVPSWPVFGRIEVLAKRTMRILLRWYINPLVEQQNSFNLAVLASLYELEAQLNDIYSDMSKDASDKPHDEAQ